MSYGNFGIELDKAFKEYRRTYLNARQQLRQAERELDAVKGLTTEKYCGEAQLRRAEAQARLAHVKASAESMERNAWAAFDSRRQQLRAELSKQLKADHVAAPEDIDAEALELLRSGILAADDYESLADRFDGNATMLRLIAKHAADAATAATDQKERGYLLMLSDSLRDGRSTVMKAFDGLAQISDTCAGKAAGRRSDPGYVEAMLGQWDSLSAPIVEAM